MNPFQIEVSVIERLREAAREHMEVASLLKLLSRVIIIDEARNKSIEADVNQEVYLISAIMASEFVEYDRKNEAHLKPFGDEA